MKKTVVILTFLTGLMAQAQALEDIACQYPLEGGDAVYSARVMLGIGFGCFNNNRTAPWPEENNEAEIPEETGFFARIYPNPNNGEMHFSYRLNEFQQGKLELFDLTGRMFSEYHLDPSNHLVSISETALPSGIYLYRVVVDGKVKVMDKLIVIK